MFCALPVVTDPHYSEYGELQTVHVETCQMMEHSSNGMRTSFYRISCLLVMSVASHHNILNKNAMYKNHTYTHVLRSSFPYNLHSI